jgi:DNA-binding CsgD family transcriptional regulator
MTQHRVSLDPADLRRWYHDEGLSTRQIAARIGVGNKTVQRHLIAAGIDRREPSCNPVPDPGTRFSRDERVAIHEAFDAWLEGVAAQYGRTPKAIRMTLARALGPASRTRSGVWERDRERVRELHAQGLRGREIDRALGWIPGRTAPHQRRMGLDPRKPLPALPSVDELRRLYLEAGNIRGLARRIGRSQRQAREDLAAAGIEIRSGPPRSHHPHRLEPHLEDMRRAYVDESVSVDDLARRYSMTARYLREFLNARGVRRVPRLTAADHERILALYAGGMSKAAIAREIGCSAPTVDHHIEHPQQQRKRREIRAA